jgi:hypothetical protein
MRRQPAYPIRPAWPVFAVCACMDAYAEPIIITRTLQLKHRIFLKSDYIPITLLKDSPEEIRDYRPISLISQFWKANNKMPGKPSGPSARPFGDAIAKSKFRAHL